MKANIVFSSLTGNTKRVAYEILDVMHKDTDIYDLKDLDHDLEGELLVLGYWVDKGRPNKEMEGFMEKLEGKRIITFGTLGAYPDSEHANQTKVNTNSILSEKNEVLGNFLCQGKINPKLTEMFMRNNGDQGQHAMTPERMKRHEDAAKHPNEEDFKNAKKFVQGIIKDLKKGEI